MKFDDFNRAQKTIIKNIYDAVREYSTEPPHEEFKKFFETLEDEI